MVLDEVWRGIDGVEALSGAQGGPLRRTVKLILDPLVIRPVQYPACAGPMLTADGATLLAARVHAAADVLRATAAWFTLLKQVRRALRITDGNPQDLYFQRCFELATVSGAPDPVRDRPTATAALHDIHHLAAGRTTQALKDHLTDRSAIGELAALIDTAWRRRPRYAPAGADHTTALAALLDSCATDRAEDTARELRALITERAGTHSGIALWYNASGVSASELGLTVHGLPVAPALGAGASTATLALPFDRTIYERVFTVLQASTERSDLPTIPELVVEEIARSCAPWALLDESLRVTAAAGVELARGLAPVTGTDGSPASEPVTSSGRVRDPDDSAREDISVRRGGTAAHRVINARWRREAYVLQARRLAVHDTGNSSDPLAMIAAELRRPWRSYLRRLWVRLHGRDVRGASISQIPPETPELWDLLDGVARSVILDHRMRVRKALTANSCAAMTDSLESRAG
ncbi:hypothetical protein [Nocardia africana]|uniref:Uncharacterized protein n=1 Tax=Nocardia africana TaxID=134964 RepID=A0A378X201_9NOCA|nr:hypothetical protein [Nocardia africana]MCC3311868.1 hypothetical protein [Nocardia africana]SUA46855.1 Uncharacterised protein [Nocardia africana]